MAKALKFFPNLIPLVLSGEKTVTWRLFDDKNLTKGDRLELIDRSTGQIFAKATISRVDIKKFKDLKPHDLDGHEKYDSKQQMYNTYANYYHQPVDEDTEVKIVYFRLNK